jgi:excinuclease ABC subunit C
VASAGLAKRTEQIYLEDKNLVRRIILPANSPALQILQRLRDEAHRFALAYHHRLRAKLIRESVLDDVAGLGARRKEKLLKRFGSVGALARASEKTISSTAGIGTDLARKIKEFLYRRK